MGSRPIIKPFEKKIIVITSPSGGGKTSIVKKLLLHMPELGFSVSATTRPKRIGEEDGVDYYFLSKDEFQRKVASGEFVEYEEVFKGIFYGTLKSEIERLWNKRKVALLDIDVKGAEKLKKIYDKDIFVIFIKPPSMESLRARLEARLTEDKQMLKERLKRAAMEMAFESKADYVVTNKDFDTAYMRVKNAIIRFLNPVPVYH
ncbi:MAG: guanylate kinase [Chitinophagales bacterium]|nr:guanylate kinase [Chitinophagales bacterium]MDW8274388.1 guanylate kinase [Chitinophagales bacterium]